MTWLMLLHRHATGIFRLVYRFVDRFVFTILLTIHNQANVLPVLSAAASTTQMPWR